MYDQSCSDPTTGGLVAFAPGIFVSCLPLFLQAQDGTLLAYYVSDYNGAPCVMCRESADTENWNNEVCIYPGVELLEEALLDSEGEVHLFYIKGAENEASRDCNGEGYRPAADEPSSARLDIWHLKSSENRTRWTKPKMIWVGYTGAINSVIQTKTGRIVLPFSYMKNRHWGERGGGFKNFTCVGYFDSTAIYSDDGGETWVQANDLSVQTPDIVSCYGAVEPVILEMEEHIWMLIRTQQGRFYESFSTDGSEWLVPQPTSIISSDSPAGLVRLSDGRIVLFWNCCKRYCYAYGGRQVLHAAISEDNGKSWIGFREVARDPQRDLPPPTTGDFGTAYPYPTKINEDKIILRTGQGKERVVLKLLDPAYLYETRQSTNWSKNLADWSVYGTRGVCLTDTPLKSLKIQRTDTEFPAAAVWNFPMGSYGKIELDIILEAQFAGLRIGLTDHYSTPFDLEEHFHNIFNIYVQNGQVGNCNLKCDEKHTLSIQWDCEGGCLVCVDGAFAAGYSAKRDAAGICYIRLTALSHNPEQGSAYIVSIDAEVDRRQINPDLL